jgi:hypothetical protein
MAKYCTSGQATHENIIRRMRIACWLLKTAKKPIRYVILIASPLQQWSRERASKLRYT